MGDFIFIYCCHVGYEPVSITLFAVLPSDRFISRIILCQRNEVTVVAQGRTDST